MFHVVMTTWSLIVEAMRACAQEGSRGPCPPGKGSAGAFAPSRAEGFGGGTPPNSKIKNFEFK